MACPVHFISSDRRFALCLPAELIHHVQVRCSSAGSSEIGGILVGNYSENQRVAEVTAISDSPEDSVTSYSFFIRGTRGLCQWLRNLWKRNSQYYLGEWHFHPGDNCKPSGLDEKTMTGIARADAYKCPEPILLLVGGNKTSGWLLHAQVTTRDGTTVVLQKHKSK